MPNASLPTLTRKPLSGSTLTQPEQIAREILEDVKAAKVIGGFAACLFGFEPEDPSILTPSEISEIRAEVKRRVALAWQEAA